jgi:ferredoxin
MPTIHFQGNLFGPACTVDSGDDDRLVDICDRAWAPVPFSCRGATCGTCRVEVLEGIDLFQPREGAEAALHSALEDPCAVRLACQAKVRRGPGVIRLRIADDEI